jgi:RNA polymerase sigma-70 factor (ECF subfamily)
VTLDRLEERELVERARLEPAAFGELYRRHLPTVQCFALSRLGNPADAEDVASDVFERALRAIGRYRYTGVPFGAWLLRIAAHAVVDHCRRRRWHVDLDDLDLENIAAPGCLEDLVAGQEQLRRALALRPMPASQRAVLALRFGEDLDMAEVAERIGRTVGAVKLLQHRALMRVRAELARDRDALELAS